MSTDSVKPSRGVRNKNPLNIRVGNAWLGEVKENTDGDFEQFTQMKYGLRAAFILLRRYVIRLGLNTVAKIIARWAPEPHPLLMRYINFVSAETGFKPDQVIAFEKNTMCALVRAMSKMESGYTPTDSTLDEAFELSKSNSLV